MPPTPDRRPADPPSNGRLVAIVVLALVAAAGIAWLLLQDHGARPPAGVPAVPASLADAGRPSGVETSVPAPSGVGAFVARALPATTDDGDPAARGPGRLVGRVEHADGTPPGSGRIVAWNGSAGREAPLQADGRFELAGLATGRWTLHADADGLREEAPVEATAADEPVEGLVVRLQGRSALEVTVRDGRTLSTVKSCVATLDGRTKLPCGADGRVTLGPRASGAAVLVVEAPGFASRRVQAVFPASGRASLDVLVTGGATLSGTVVTPEKQPVAGAVVTVGRWSMSGGDDPATLTDPVTASDAEGRFVLTGLAPGRVTACASAGGYARTCGEEASLSTDSARHGLELVLHTGGAIAGRVVGPGGAGVGGAVLELVDQRARRPLGSTTGLADGTFRFDALAAGTYAIEAVTPAGRALASGVTVVDREETSVELLLGASTLSGRVTFPDGRPAAAALVEVRPASVEGRFSSATADAAGAFRFEGLVGDTFLVRASLVDAGSAEVRGAKAGSEVTLVLAETGAIAGTVRAPDGTPVTDFDVTLVPVAGATLGGVSAGYRRSSVASPEGTFAEQGLPAGRYTLRVATLTSPVATLEAEVRARETTRVEVLLEQGVTVSGTTLLDGAPRAGCRVSEIRRGRFRVPDQARVATTREDGRFTLPGVDRGQTGLAANCGDSIVGVRWIDTGAEPTTDVAIELGRRERPHDEDAPEFGGIGLSLGIDREGRAFVRFTSEGGPAFLAGLGRGDTLVSVDGWPAQGRSMEELVARIRGPIGTGVALSLLRAGSGQPYATVVERVRVVTGGP